MGLLGDTV